MNNLDLEKALSAAVAREREASALVLRLLREVEKRALYLERGYSSLFAYCREYLGYTEPEAMLRIQAMRLMRRVPEVEKKIEKGEISLSVASLVQAKTKELEASGAREVVREIEGKSKREAERALAGLFPEEARPERARAVTEELTEVRFTVDREEYELLQKLLDRRAHSNFKRSYKELFLQLAKAELKKLLGKQEEDALPQRLELAQRNGRVSNPSEPAKLTTSAALTRPAKPTNLPSHARLSRHIPSSTQRHIWRRDQARCQYENPLTHHRCEETTACRLTTRSPTQKAARTAQRTCASSAGRIIDSGIAREK